ncbi:cytidine deaminase [Gracilimonas mengyeensis]|uniref:Cytidine deaminase, homotetrameric n=1 Tax=Gracilimonas mengyeensis TaxID=1302730 RepID=A0A521FL52_9BACT|nr:cytidine deaminase [Gracilimonas mengyeensis]SMO96938.1 cytidine deaminase, homotetrameric [Gracilimonas mengyeensis]
MSWNSLLENAYVPYSEAAKACIVESDKGNFFAGVRIENISYPVTISSLQAACSICLSEGETPIRVFLPLQIDADQLSYWKDEFDLEIIKTDEPPLDKLTSCFKEEPEDFSSQEELKNLINRAVTPNSDFPVSAILFVEGGYFEGVNVEVSDWSMGLCAERVAIAKAKAAGISKFKRMDVHTLKGEFSSPCGACRQVVTEMMPYHELSLYHADGSLSKHLSADLLPFSFKTSSLKK